MRRAPADNRSALLSTATGLFLAHGYAGTSMAMIAARHGGSKQTLYFHFRSKEDLFVAVMLERGNRLMDTLSLPFNVEEPLEVSLSKFGHSFLMFIATDEAIAFRRMIIAEGYRSNLAELYFSSGPLRLWAKVAQHLERAMANGRLQPSDAWTAAMHFQGLLEAGPYQRRLEGLSSSMEDPQAHLIAHRAAEVFLRAHRNLASPFG